MGGTPKGKMVAQVAPRTGGDSPPVSLSSLTRQRPPSITMETNMLVPYHSNSERPGLGFPFCGLKYGLYRF
jgi:hypothetical protein